MDLIKTLEQEEIKRLAKHVPDFSPGDTVKIDVQGEDLVLDKVAVEPALTT